MKAIDPAIIDFLELLNENNNRQWFQEHKDIYKYARKNADSFVDALVVELNKEDVINPVKKMRINRDIRFSKDKTPYKTGFPYSLMREGAHRRGSYFFRIGYNEIMVGGGFYGPESHDLLTVRKEWARDVSALEEIVDSSRFRSFYPNGIEGERLKTAPKGFDRSHPSLSWLQLKQFYAIRKFSVKQALDNNFAEQVLEGFYTVRPFFDYMSRVLVPEVLE